VGRDRAAQAAYGARISVIVFVELVDGLGQSAACGGRHAGEQVQWTPAA